MIRTRLRFTCLKVLTFACLIVVPIAAQAQSQPMVQVPFTSVVAGVPASTYNGTTASPCSSSDPSRLDSLGDGCPATQATLSDPYGAAIDSYNNIFIADYNDAAVRVVYQGGSAVAQALVTANPKYSFTPTPGVMYIFGGSTSTLSAKSGIYYCTGSSGTTALNSYGDGCPVQYAYIKPRNVTTDADGNIFVTSLKGVGDVNDARIIYIGGAAAAKLITTYNPTITNPVPGYVYPLSASGDFNTIRDIAVDSNENVYASDNGTNQVLKFTGTGWTVYLNYASGTSTLPAGDGGPVASASVGGPLNLLFDKNNNLYIGDVGNDRVRVVYNAGTTPPLYIEGSNSTIVTNPQPGYIYTVAGGGSTTTTGSLASDLSLGSISSIGLDPAGNLYVIGSNRYIWKINPGTGVAVAIGGYGSSTTTYSASSSPAEGVPCNGASSGPVMTDAYADGCPATEVAPYGPSGRIIFDSEDNFYNIEQRSGEYPASILRKYSYENQFGSVTTGSTATSTLAFTPTTDTTYSSPANTYTLTGNATSEFSDAGNDLCSTYATTSAETCVFYTTFQPALAGARLASISLSSSGTTLATAPIGGIGTGPQLTLDPATQTTIGSGLSPSGVGVDQSGNLYIADATTGNIYKSTSGASPIQFASGFVKPAQIAVDGIGNVYIADPGNNRIALVTQAGTISTFLSTYGSIPLNAPAGVAVDLTGSVYVADTGNNRILKVSNTGAVTEEPFSGISSPQGLAVDAAGDIYVADSANSRIVELTAAGVQSAVAISPSLITPVAVALDPAGDLYIADSANLNLVEVPAGSSTANVLLGDASGLTGLSADATGDLFLATSSLGGLLELNRTQITVSYPLTNVDETANQLLTLNNTGNAQLTLGSSLSSATTSSFTISPATTNGCSTNKSLPSGTSCILAATFQPQSISSFTDSITFPTTAINSASALLTGNGVQETNTTTTLSYTTSTNGLPLNNQPFTVTATITPATNAGTLNGTVTFTIDGSPQPPATVSVSVVTLPLTLLTGAHTITATYNGNSLYAASQATLSLPAVVPAATTLTLTTNTTPQNSVPFTLTATLSSAASQGSINGTVTFVVDGGAPVTATTANSSASIPLTLYKGQHTIIATYSGDSYYITSSTTLPINVVPNGTSSVALQVASPTGTITYGQSVVIAATITTGNASTVPSGTVAFAVDGVTASTVPFASSINTTLAIAAGSHTITASYSGDNNYRPSSGTLPITVAQAPSTITLAVTPNASASGNSFTLTATANTTATGTVSFSAGTASFGSALLSNAVATLTTTTNVLNSYTFTASYSGDSNFLPSTVTVTPAPTFMPSFAPPTAAIPQGGVATANLNLNSFYGYTGTVQVSCSGMPANSTCRLAPVSTSLAADSVQGLQMQLFTNVSSSLAGVVPVDRQNRRLTLSALALCLLLTLPLWRRRRSLQGTVFAILLLAAALGASGCGSDTRQTIGSYVTPTGTYSVNVSATDGHITQSAALSFTVATGPASAQ